MNKELLTREEIEKAGFIYEPDRAKCKSIKLKLSVPGDALINDEYKAEIISQIPFVYVHEVKKTENPYEGNPNFLTDPRVLVIGHNIRKFMTENEISELLKNDDWELKAIHAFKKGKLKMIKSIFLKELKESLIHCNSGACLGENYHGGMTSQEWINRGDYIQKCIHELEAIDENNIKKTD